MSTSPRTPPELVEPVRAMFEKLHNVIEEGDDLAIVINAAIRLTVWTLWEIYGPAGMDEARSDMIATVDGLIAQCHVRESCQGSA